MSLLGVWERIFLNPSRALGRQGRGKDSVSLPRGDSAGAALMAVARLAPQKGQGQTLGSARHCRPPESQGRSQCSVLALGLSQLGTTKSQTCLSISDPRTKPCLLPAPHGAGEFHPTPLRCLGLPCLSPAKSLTVKNPLPQLTLSEKSSPSVKSLPCWHLLLY